jgi:hypothetical protein
VSDTGISPSSYSSAVGTKTYVQNIIAGLSSFMVSDTKAWKSEFLHDLSKEKTYFEILYFYGVPLAVIFHF